MRRAVSFVSLGALLAVVSCSLSALEGYSGGDDPSDGSTDVTAPSDGSGGNDGANDSGPADAGADGDARPSGCGGRPGVGATMVRVLDAGFCIDTTEVSLDQYAEFIADNPPISAECSWKSSYTLPAFVGKAAIGDVDWCDAYSYCKWAGKRLCGGIKGVTLDLTNSKTIASEWHYACTHGGDPSFPFPNGTTAKPAVCLYYDSPDSGAARPIADNPACTGPEGIFDLSGNVWEWEDACDRSKGLSKAAECNLRGGGFLRPSSDWGACANVPGGWTRESHVADTGIRCCSDYTP